MFHKTMTNFLTSDARQSGWSDMPCMWFRGCGSYMYYMQQIYYQCACACKGSCLGCKSDVHNHMVCLLAVALARTDKRAAELEAAGFQPVLGDLTTLDVLKSAARDGTLSSLQ